MSGNIINLLDSDSDNNTSVEQISAKKHPPINSASENADAQQESEKENQTPQGINMGNSSKNTKRGLKPALLSFSRSSGAHLHSDDDLDFESPQKIKNLKPSDFNLSSDSDFEDCKPKAAKSHYKAQKLKQPPVKNKTNAQCKPAKMSCVVHVGNNPPFSPNEISLVSDSESHNSPDSTQASDIQNSSCSATYIQNSPCSPSDSEEHHSPLRTFVPKAGAKFGKYEDAYQQSQKYAVARGFRWAKTTGTKNRGPGKKYRIRRLVCQGYGRKQTRKTKGARQMGPSVRCGCTASIQMYEHMNTGRTIINKVQLEHNYPCEPGIKQLLRGRRKAGVNPSSIPVEVLKEVANMFQAQMSTQSIRDLLTRKPNFPKSILIDKDFVRSLRLFIRKHGISADMPCDVIRNKVGISQDMTAIEFEDVIIASGLSNSTAALAAREALTQHIDDLLAFLSYVEANDPMFVKKVVFLKGTEKIGAIFCMSGYQRAKLFNFGDILIFDCKRSGICVLEWPKAILTIIDQEGKLHDTCTGMMCVENYDM